VVSEGAGAKVEGAGAEVEGAAAGAAAGAGTWVSGFCAVDGGAVGWRTWAGIGTI